MKFVFLSDMFYSDYAGCEEIEIKRSRPYVMVCISVDGIDFAVPMRSHIKHQYVFWTDKENGCGLDFSKTVVLSKREYVDVSNAPHIRPNEYDALRGQEHLIKQRLLQYINTYKKARKRLDVERNRRICEYSTLQYFETYI